jgi:hypothetical protein
MLRALRGGYALAWARLRPRALAMAALFGTALVLMVGLVERRAGPIGAVDRCLSGTFGVVLPIVTFGIVLEGSARTNLAESVWSLARHGVSRRAVALGAILAMTMASAAFAALFAILSIVFAGGVQAPLGLVLADALTSARIGVLASTAYVGWFAVFATFGRRGQGRVVPLLLDYALRGSALSLAVLFPRAHALNLLGGRAPLSMSQEASAAFLAVTAVTLDLIAAARCGR